MQSPLENLLDSLDLGICTVHAESGAIRFRSAAAQRRLGNAPSLDDAFRNARFLGPFDGWPAELPRIARAVEPSLFQCVIRPTPESPPGLLTLRCAPLHADAPGAPPEIVVLIQESRTAEALDERLEVSKRLASLGKLATRVAHELNNPLDGILRYINLALRMVNDTSEGKLKGYLSESRTGLMRMVQIIGDLLEFSRTTEGEFDESDVNEIVEQAIRANATAAERCRVVVTADFRSQPMPATRGSRLYQVCCNLVRNAIDAMPDGGRLFVTTGVVDGHVVIQVADTGVGLPPDATKMFEPFFTTKPPGKGTGLGLAICKDFVEDMKGTIVAGPNEREGAVFTVRIPVESFGAPVARHRRIGHDAPAPGRARPQAASTTEP